MANDQAIASSAAEHPAPVVHTIGVADLKDALARGIDDFRAMPSHILFLGIIYPLVGLVASRMTFGYSVLPLLFPLVAGLTLLGPLAAIGLYELSRRREQGLDVAWRHAFGVLRSPSIGGLAAVGAVLLGIFILWIGVAHAIYVNTFGIAAPASVWGFVDQVMTTSAGWTLIMLGNAAGFLFAVVVLSISVVSLPMQLDRNVGAATAMATSVRAVAANPAMMALWGLIVAVSLAIGCLPFFIGLAIVMPVLGHATWHLYRKLVER